MKTFLILSVLAVSFSTAHAEIRFPSNSFEVAKLEDARKAAETKQVPIAFVYTDKETTCPLCQNATHAIIKAFRSSAVIVYVLTTEGVPTQVSTELHSRGEYIPKVALFNSDVSKSYGLVTYEEIKAEGERPLRKLKSSARMKD